MAKKKTIELARTRDLGKVWEQLTDEQKEQVYQECETMDPEASRPLTPRERARFERIVGRNEPRGRGRPRIGQGASRISLTVEKDLLGRADRFARKHGISRAELFARGVEFILRQSA